MCHPSCTMIVKEVKLIDHHRGRGVPRWILVNDLSSFKQWWIKQAPLASVVKVGFVFDYLEVVEAWKGLERLRLKSLEMRVAQGVLSGLHECWPMLPRWGKAPHHILDLL